MVGGSDSWRWWQWEVAVMDGGCDPPPTKEIKVGLNWLKWPKMDFKGMFIFYFLNRICPPPESPPPP